MRVRMKQWHINYQAAIAYSLLYKTYELSELLGF
jgi:hypothetical protein